MQSPRDKKYGNKTGQECPGHPEPVHIPNRKGEASETGTPMAGLNVFERSIVHEGEIGIVEPSNQTINVQFGTVGV